jgi:hypothetical protein
MAFPQSNGAPVAVALSEFESRVVSLLLTVIPQVPHELATSASRTVAIAMGMRCVWPAFGTPRAWLSTPVTRWQVLS